MISNLKISNFKAFGETVEIDFKNITLISGLNSGGKSSIYQSLLMLAESENHLSKLTTGIYPTLILNTDILELGKPEEILNDKNNKIIQFEIILKNTEKKIKKIMHFELLDKFNKSNNSAFVLKYLKVISDNESYYEAERHNSSWEITGYQSFQFESVGISDLIFNNIEENFSKKFPQDIEEILDAREIFNKHEVFNEKVIFKGLKDIKFLNFFMYDFDININQITKCINSKYLEYLNLDKLKEKLEQNDYPKEKLKLSNNNIDFLEFSLNNQVNQSNFLKPFRGTPKRIYRKGFDVEPIKRFNNEKKIPYDFNLENNKILRGTIKEAFKFWCVDFFKLADDIEIEEPVEGLLTEIFLKKGAKKIPINNLGFGVSQIIPVIYKTLLSDKSFLIVDEPEIHLHPKMQSLLGDFFFKMSLLKKKIFIETHSEYIIDKLIFLQIKNNKKHNINMYWVEQMKTQSILKKLEHDELGYIINSPDNFLTEKRKMAEELTKLRLERLSL